MIAIPARLAPTPIPAFVPVERLDVEGSTLYWIAKTMFMTADVGIGVEVSVSNSVLVAAAELPILVTGTSSGVVLVTGTAGGTR
jgi:hypothetical protein